MNTCSMGGELMNWSRRFRHLVVVCVMGCVPGCFVALNGWLIYLTCHLFEICTGFGFWVYQHHDIPDAVR